MRARHRRLRTILFLGVGLALTALGGLGYATDARQDLALANAISNAKKRVVLATTEVNEKGEGKFLGAPEDLLRDIGGRFGNGLFPNDPGGVIRRTSHSIDRLETFGVAAVETAEGRQVDPGQFQDEGAWIDYVGPPGT